MVDGSDPGLLGDPPPPHPNQGDSEGEGEVVYAEHGDMQTPTQNVDVLLPRYVAIPSYERK